MISRIRWMEKRSEHRRLRGFTDRSQPMFGKSAPESFLDVSSGTLKLSFAGQEVSTDGLPVIRSKCFFVYRDSRK